MMLAVLEYYGIEDEEMAELTRATCYLLTKSPEERRILRA